MSMLHAPTLLFSLIAIATTSGILLLISSRQNREERGLVHWGAGNLIGAMALILLALRGAAHDRLTIDIANAGLFLAYMLNWAGMRHFCRRPAPWSWIVMPSLVWLVLCQGPVFYASVEARIAVNSLFSGTISLATALTLWNLVGERLVSRVPAIVWLLIHSAVFLVRIPLVLLSSIPPGEGIIASPVVLVVLFESMIHVSIASFLQLSLTKDRAENRYRMAAETDMLTGIPNRRAFFERAAALVTDAVQQGRPACVLVIDIDRFKAINDNLGHAGGDMVLIQVAQAIGQHLRPTDIFGRLGGEEFACLLPDTTMQAATVIAEGLRARIAGLAISAGSGMALNVSASIGIAVVDERTDSLDRLLDEADAGLYQAKRAGRDRVVAMDIDFREAG